MSDIVDAAKKAKNGDKAALAATQISLSLKLLDMKKEFHEWSLLSHVDCFLKIFQSESLTGKCIWTLCLLIFTSLTATLVVLNITGFYSYEVVTKMETFHQVPTEFPTVTMCDANMFSTQAAQSLIQNISLESFGADVYDMSFGEAMDKLGDLTELTKMYLMKPDMSKQRRLEIGFNLSQIIMCQFNGQPCNMTRDFRWYAKSFRQKVILAKFEFIFGDEFNKVINKNG